MHTLLKGNILGKGDLVENPWGALPMILSKYVVQFKTMESSFSDCSGAYIVHIDRELGLECKQ